ncbi:MAG: hypothetical protein ACR2OT_02380 [Parvibaculales bacterium]
MSNGNPNNITPLPTPSANTSSGGSGGGDDLSARVAVLESELKHLATKADIANLKIWFLGTFLALALQLIGIALLLWRVFAVSGG